MHLLWISLKNLHLKVVYCKEWGDSSVAEGSWSPSLMTWAWIPSIHGKCQVWLHLVTAPGLGDSGKQTPGVHWPVREPRWNKSSRFCGTSFLLQYYAVNFCFFLEVSHFEPGNESLEMDSKCLHKTSQVTGPGYSQSESKGVRIFAFTFISTILLFLFIFVF